MALTLTQVLAAWSAAAVAAAVRRLVLSHVKQKATTRRLRLALGGWVRVATAAATARAQARAAFCHRRAQLLGCGWVALTSHVAAAYHTRRALADAVRGLRLSRECAGVMFLQGYSLARLSTHVSYLTTH